MVTPIKEGTCVPCSHFRLQKYKEYFDYQSFLNAYILCVLVKFLKYNDI